MWCCKRRGRILGTRINGYGFTERRDREIVRTHHRSLATLFS